MYKPVRLDAQGRAVRLGAQGKAEQRLGGVEWLGGAERRLGGVGEAAELCGAAELLGVPLTYMYCNNSALNLEIYILLFYALFNVSEVI